MIGAHRWMILAAFMAATPAYAGITYSVEGTVNKSIVVTGTFEASDDPYDLYRVFSSSGAKIVTFNSPGGHINTAMEIGRMVRKLGLATIQVRGYECSSACAFAYMGGAFRLAEPGAIGVHKITFEDGTMTPAEAASGAQQALSTLMEYMSEMGIDTDLVTLMLQYEADDMRYLSKSEMLKYHVISITPEGAREILSQDIGDSGPQGYTDLKNYVPPIPAPRPDPSGKQERAISTPW